jgi:hypothetical protein
MLLVVFAQVASEVGRVGVPVVSGAERSLCHGTSVLLPKGT